MSGHQHHADCAEQGLYDKYSVRRRDGLDMPGGPHAGCRYFVLDLTHDPAARTAALVYAAAVDDERPRLAAELHEEVARLGGAP